MQLIICITKLADLPIFFYKSDTRSGFCSVFDNLFEGNCGLLLVLTYQILPIIIVFNDALHGICEMHILTELCLKIKKQYSSTNLQCHHYLGELWAPLKYRSSAAAFSLSIAQNPVKHFCELRPWPCKKLRSRTATEGFFWWILPFFINRYARRFMNKTWSLLSLESSFYHFHFLLEQGCYRAMPQLAKRQPFWWISTGKNCLFTVLSVCIEEPFSLLTLFSEV